MTTRLVFVLLLSLLGCGEAPPQEPTSAEAPPASTLERLERSVADDPRDHEAWGELARERLAAEDADGAAEAAERALALAGDEASADDAETLARAHLAAERLEPARDAYARAVAIDPARHAARIALGRSEERLEHAEEAEAAYRAVVEADERDVEARMHLARLLIVRARQPGVSPTEDGDEEDPRGEMRREAGALLRAARAHLDGEDDPRFGAIASYEADLAELEARAARRRRVAEAQEEVSQMLLGSLGEGALQDVVVGSSELGSSDLGDLMAEGVGASEGYRRLAHDTMPSGGGGGVGGLSTGGRARSATSPAVRVSVRATAQGALDGAVVTRVARRHLGAMRRCHERAARRDPSIAGTVAVRFRIGGAGTVEAPSASGSIADEGLRRCVEGLVRRMAFPAAGGSTAATVTGSFGS